MTLLFLKKRCFLIFITAYADVHLYQGRIQDFLMEGGKSKFLVKNLCFDASEAINKNFAAFFAIFSTK